MHVVENAVSRYVELCAALTTPDIRLPPGSGAPGEG